MVARDGADWNTSAVMTKVKCYCQTFFLGSIIDVHCRWARVSMGLSIPVFPEPLLGLVLEVCAECFICLSTGIKPGVQAIPPLEKGRNYGMILAICQMKQWIAQTNPDQLLPIGMIEVGIQYLLLMHQGHPLKAPGYVVQWGP